MAHPTDFQGANRNLLAPEGAESWCGDLPVFTGSGMTISCWRFTPEELATVAETGVVWLSVFAESRVPPVMLSADALVEVGGKPASPEPDLPRNKRLD